MSVTGVGGSHVPAPPPQQPLPEVHEARSVGDWLRKNLFSTWYNSLLTIVLLPLLGYVIFRVFRFVFVSSDWTVVEVNLTNLMVGRFPRGELWRVWVAVGLVALVVGLAFGAAARGNAERAKAQGVVLTTSWSLRVRRVMPLVLLVAGIVVFVRTLTPVLLLGLMIIIAAAGFAAGKRLPRHARPWMIVVSVAGLFAAYLIVTQFGGVAAKNWGGFMLNVFLAVGGIMLCYPLGVLLALGRRSSLPAIRVVCVVYIEMFRALPLIAFLYLGWLILPFFLPSGFPNIDKTWRALIVLILFTAAYIAEIVRGGLQSIPEGQYEAAYALGLRVAKINRLVILPQALRNVIPATVGQFISLFKDTSLVFIVGLLDLLDVAKAITSQEDFLAQGVHAQTLTFAAFVFWMGSYWMSRESQRLEKRLGLGER